MHRNAPDVRAFAPPGAWDNCNIPVARAAMPRLFLHAALRTVANPLYRAFLAGLLLGSLAGGLALARPGDLFSCAMAVVLVVSGALSFVCHALSLQPQARQHVAGWLLVLGSGMLLALNAVERFLA
jgi:hypothetical protein